MKQEKDKWEEFKELPEAYETNDDLVPKVKYEIFRKTYKTANSLATYCCERYDMCHWSRNIRSCLSF